MLTFSNNIKFLLVLTLFVAIVSSLGVTADASSSKIHQMKTRNLFIADGTNWCGPGNNAKNCTDFGTNNETDMCCQAHDYCPWTFSKHNRSYNGFKSSNRYFTISHCECDIKFYECLLETPYKRGSNLIFSTFFDTYRAKCFAYLPCDDNLFLANVKRKTGRCFENLRVMEFDSITDYITYVKSNINNELVVALRDYMHKADHLMTEKKKNAACRYRFPNITTELTESLARRFYKSEQQPQHIIFAPVTTPTTSNAQLAEIKQTTQDAHDSFSTSSSSSSATYDDETLAPNNSTDSSIPEVQHASAPKRVFNFFKTIFKSIVHNEDLN